MAGSAFMAGISDTILEQQLNAEVGCPSLCVPGVHLAPYQEVEFQMPNTPSLVARLPQRPKVYYKYL